MHNGFQTVIVVKHAALEWTQLAAALVSRIPGHNAESTLACKMQHGTGIQLHQSIKLLRVADEDGQDSNNRSEQSLGRGYPPSG